MTAHTQERRAGRPYLRALDEQIGLLRFWSHRFAADYAQCFIDVQKDTEQQTFPSPWNGERLAWLEHSTLTEAPTYWVEADMTRLIEVASGSMPDETLEETDLLTDSGFVYLERPLRVRDKQGITVGIRAVQWQRSLLVHPSDDKPGGTWMRGFGTPVERSREGVLVTLYAAFGDDPRDEGNREVFEKVPYTNLTMLHFFGWPFGKDQRVFAAAEQEENLGTRLKAMWTLMQQRITTVTHAHASRTLTRRVGRELPQHRLRTDLKVRVVTLRRTRPETDVMETDVEWSHRWIVRGHWRNQFLPSNRSHRLQWIAPFQKGPEDKPLIVKSTIFDWRR